MSTPSLASTWRIVFILGCVLLWCACTAQAETQSVFEELEILNLPEHGSTDTVSTAWDLVQLNRLEEYFGDEEGGLLRVTHDGFLNRIPRRASPRVSLVVGDPSKRRLSFVWQGPPAKLPDNSPFKSFRFRHRWTQYSFATTIVTYAAVPSRQNRIRGLLLADVCISSKFIPCTYGRPYDIRVKLSWVLNTISQLKEMDFWVMGGDNLYDEDSSVTADFYSALSRETTSIPLITVPGNHDFWTKGSPSTATNNQLGYGYLQWYLMDSEASCRQRLHPTNDSDSFPFAFPSKNENVTTIPSKENFFHYSSLGPIGFIAYSGAHKFDPELFSTACRYFAKGQPGESAAFIFLIGHWHKENFGCEKDMYTSRVFELTQKGARGLRQWCTPLARQNRIYFVEGHHHENIKVGDFGMRVAGMGMFDTGEFGFPLVEVVSNGLAKHLTVSYVELSRHPKDPLLEENFGDLRKCVRERSSVYACLPDLPFVRTWVNATINNGQTAMMTVV